MSMPRSVTWTLSMLLLAAAALGLSHVGAATPLVSLTGRIFSPIDGVVHALISPIADFVANAGDYGSIKKENSDLRAQNERLTSEVTQLREGQAQAQQASDLNQSTQLFPNEDFTSAGVIARDPSNVHDAVLIDKGTDAGLRNGMIVIGKGGALIGTIQRATATSAWVRLITDPSSDVNAEVQETRATAIISGALGHKLQLQFVDAGTDVKPGDTVVTSGLGGNYRKGLLIGRVSKVEGGPLDLFKTIQVEPAVRPGTLETVLIMTSFIPSRVSAGP
jgi:rod shape-determining protein MreC